MKPDLVIGIDSSTTATKAIAFDRRGRAVAEGRAPVPMSSPKPGWYEQEVSDWTGAVSKALKQLVRKVDANRVAGLAIASQRETFAQFDAKDRPLRPGTVWLDERSHQEVKDLANEIGADELRRISGKPSDITPCLPRCRWLQTHMPKLWKNVAKTSEVHGTLVHFLTGHWKTSICSADPMGLIDMERLDWSERIIGAVGLTRAQLPSLHRAGEMLGEVTPEAAKLTGLKEGTPVIAGGGDGQCAGTGANIFVKGRAYLNLGTAAVSGSYGKAYAHDPVFRTETAVAEDGYIYETAIRTGTFLVNWITKEMFNGNEALIRAIEKEAAAVPVGANGLVLLPYWSGVMTPYWDTGARGVIAGLSANHKRGDLYRALMEGVALEQTMMSNGIAAATSLIDHFVIMGGGSKSDVWCQIIADASGREVKRLETVEASALGAAMVAAKGCGWFGTIAEASAKMSGRMSKTFRPRTREAKVYAELLGVYRDLWPRISEWNGRLQDFARKHAT